MNIQNLCSFNLLLRYIEYKDAFSSTISSSLFKRTSQFKPLIGGWHIKLKDDVLDLVSSWNIKW
jgi:hypothetical protein